MLHIQLQRDDFDDFLHIADELMSGIIEVAQGKEVLSGKSLVLLPYRFTLFSNLK